MPSIFTRIIRGEIPCHKVAEDDRCLAFLDIRPINPGHTLVIPKLEVDDMFELPADVLGHLLPFAQPIAKALKQLVPCTRVGVLVAGLEVPHAHVHLIPFDNASEMTFLRARPAEMDELAALAKQIRALL